MMNLKIPLVYIYTLIICKCSYMS